jgi:hypothetical protein
MIAPRWEIGVLVDVWRDATFAAIAALLVFVLPTLVPRDGDAGRMFLVILPLPRR